MSRIYKANQIYNEEVTKATESEQVWKELCQTAGRLYRYEFPNILLIHAQKPNASLVADYDTWKKVDRYVKRGSKGIAVLPSRALQPYIRYVFDVEDTGGKKQNLTWNLEGDNLFFYLQKVGVDISQAKDRKDLEKLLKDFTKEQIDGIMKEEKQFQQLNMLAGRVITVQNEETPEPVMENLIRNSILYVTGTRCGFDLSSEEQDLSQIVNVTAEDDIYALGSLVCDVSCNVLRSISRSMQQIERERRMNYGNQVSHGSRRDVISQYHSGARGVETGQVRNHGDGVSGGQLQREVSDASDVWETERSVTTGGGGSQSDGGFHRESISQETSAEGEGFHHGNVETEAGGTKNRRGNGDDGSHQPVSLTETSPADTEVLKELNKELEELNSLGSAEGEAVYQQASLFDYMENTKELSQSSGFMEKLEQDVKEHAKGKYNYLNPKKEAVVPHEYIVQVLLRGSGFQNGKQRIYEMYQHNITPSERAGRIKKEYGLGGAGWPIEGYGLHGYDTFKAKGLRLQWRDEEGEKEGYISWSGVEAEIGALILSGEYYTPPEQSITEEELEYEDAYREIIGQEEEHELTDDEIEEILEADRQRYEERYEKEQELKAEEEETKLRDRNGTDSDRQNPTPENYHFDSLLTESAGAKTRFEWNIAAIRTLKQIEAEDRMATKPEQDILAKYVGWGGLSEAFDRTKENWSHEYEALRELLTDEEYRMARETVTNAFYTPPEVISSIYRGLSSFGFATGNILEPSAGIGHFFGNLPETMEGSHLYGVEKDSISGRIAKQLYPGADISVCGFEDVTYEDNFFDVVVGNVPFGDFKIYDRVHNPEEFKIHDYFIAKSVDLVRPGGMVAVITTKGTMDKQNSSVRRYLAQRAELVGAIRLPNITFKGNAGTEVTSDILFFQKRERKIQAEPDWVHLGMTEDGIPVNSYFAQHPEMILGHMVVDTGRYGEHSNYTVCVNDNPDFSLQEALSGAMENIRGEMQTFERLDEESVEECIPADPDVKNFTYTFVDNKLYFRKDSKMYLQEAGEKAMKRIQGMDSIRKATRHLIAIQLAGCSEEELKEAQSVLNVEYDTFVGEYGYITTSANARAFRDDGDYPLLCSLEVVDEDGKVTKADMFHKQTIKSKDSVERVETAVEALNISINEYNEVNLPFMLSIYEPDISDAMEEVKKKTGDEDIYLSETLKKDLQRQKIIQELKGIIFLNPQRYQDNSPDMGWETSDEYLSGNVRDKLRVAKAMAETNPELFADNVEALSKVQPKDLDASEIDVRIGTTWIEEKDYEEFIYELLNTPRRARSVRTSWYSSGIQVHLNRYNMEWSIENKSLDKHSIAASKTHGTSRMDAYSIFENTLNLRTITVRDRIEDGDGKYHYEINTKETMLAREKQSQMKEAFREWIFAEPERRNKYVNYYNETFNNVRLREYDGSHLTFPGMNPDITLNPHQVNAVARILMGGNTLLAHCVGAGKSFEMMAACMEQKRLGLTNKTVMVVPKSLIRQTASEFLRLYPSANILVTTERDFEKKRRQQFISRIATGDYDCIIMSHSQFEKIPISAEHQQSMMNRQIEEITEAIRDMKERNSERWTIKQMEAHKKKLEEQLKKMMDESRKDDLIAFEELGIDSIMVDEAHAYKNLAIFSKMNVSGITGGGSQRAMDMFLKCEYINEINGGRGIVFATGTPVSNTMCEMYVMQSFLQKDTLEQMGIYHFDSWAANFGEQTTALELTVEGSGFRFKTRFNKFINLPELMNIYREVADIQTRDMLDLDVPTLRGEKYIIVESEPDWYVKQVMEEFVKRAETIRNGGVDPSVDNFLKITHEARLLGTDARLLDVDAPNNPDGKLNKVVDNVCQEYEKAKQDGIIGTQLIFSDIGTPKGAWSPEGQTGSFDVYNYIKTELVKRGIPAEEIAFIHDAGTDVAKEKLFREMRTGNKKVLIGSTDKCGTGVNVQTHLIAMHHVDCPWKPSSIEQREGRGLRQGNENSEVAVYRYVTKGTFDAYSWSLVENKQRFISQVMTDKVVSRTCEDIDEATLSYAEIKAVATGNPLIKEKMEIDNEVQRLKMLKASYDSTHYNLQDQFMIKFPKLIAAATEKLACVHEDVAERDKIKTSLLDEEFAITVAGVTYTERADGGTALLKAASEVKVGTTGEVGMFRGFHVLVEKNFMGSNYLVLRGKTDYKLELSTSPVGTMVKLEHLFDGIQESIAFLEEHLQKYQRDMEQAKADYEKPFAYEQELKDKLARQIELNTQLDLGNNPMEEQRESIVAESPSPYMEDDKNRR